MFSRGIALGSLIAVLASTGVMAQTSILERQEDMFRRNVGSREQQRAQFPPHRIAGNLYYVGSESLASYSGRHARGAHPDQYELGGCRTEPAEVGRGSGVRLRGHRDHPRQPRARRSHARRCTRQATDGRERHGHGSGRSVPRAYAARGQAAPDRPSPSRRRGGLSRRFDARRTAHAGTHPGLHHVDADRRGERRVLRRGDHRQHG